VDVLIAATPDGSQAFALYSPYALNSTAASYAYRIYAAVGTLSQVETAVKTIRS
jgi:hypothetical protein